MTFDLSSLRVLFGALPVQAIVATQTSLEADLAPEMTLCVVNLIPAEDSLIGFKGTPWHVHGSFIFCSRDGCYIEMTPEEVFGGLADGCILICERWFNKRLQDRWLAHRDYLGDFRYMEQGEEIRVKRFQSVPPA